MKTKEEQALAFMMQYCEEMKETWRIQVMNWHKDRERIIERIRHISVFLEMLQSGYVHSNHPLSLPTLEKADAIETAKMEGYQRGYQIGFAEGKNKKSVPLETEKAEEYLTGYKEGYKEGFEKGKELRIKELKEMREWK